MHERLLTLAKEDLTGMLWLDNAFQFPSEMKIVDYPTPEDGGHRRDDFRDSSPSPVGVSHKVQPPEDYGEKWQQQRYYREQSQAAESEPRNTKYPHREWEGQKESY